MIETHVVNATLQTALHEETVYHWLRFINGLVAPSFVFASGMAFAITLRRKLPDYLAMKQPLFKQLTRLLMVLAIGYILHIPKFSLSHLLYVAGEEAWRLFFQVDVLQCIAVTVLGMQVLIFLSRSERRFAVTVVVIAPLIVAVTPLVWMVDFGKFLPLPLAAYLTPADKSMFPLFPWAAFLMMGVVAGYAFLEWKDRMPKLLLWSGIICVGLSFALEPVLARTYPVYDYWRGSPSFFLLRLGLVFLLCGLMFWFEKSRGVSRNSAVALMGRESLMVYVAHLLLIYGNFGTFNFRDTVDRTFGYPLALAVSVLLIAAMYLLALVWSRIKRGPAKVRRAVEWGFVGVLVAVLIFAPA